MAGLEHGRVALVVVDYLLLCPFLALDAWIVRLVDPWHFSALHWVVYKRLVRLRCGCGSRE